jgi:serine/threonine protein kinase
MPIRYKIVQLLNKPKPDKHDGHYLVRLLSEWVTPKHTSVRYHIKLVLMGTADMSSSRRAIYEVSVQKWLYQHRTQLILECPYVLPPTYAQLISTHDLNRYLKFTSKPTSKYAYQVLEEVLDTAPTRWSSLVISPYIDNIHYSTLTMTECVQYIFQVIYGIYYMTSTLHINHNDLHIGNTLIRRKPHVFTCVLESNTYEIDFTIHTSIIDFDRATMEHHPNTSTELLQLGVFDPTGRADVLRFMCAYMYMFVTVRQLMPLDWVADIFLYDKKLKHKIIHILTDAPSRDHCYLQYGDDNESTYLRNRKLLKGVRSPMEIMQKLIDTGLRYS